MCIVEQSFLGLDSISGERINVGRTGIPRVIVFISLFLFVKAIFFLTFTSKIIQPKTG